MLSRQVDTIFGVRSRICHNMTLLFMSLDVYDLVMTSVRRRLDAVGPLMDVVLDELWDGAMRSGDEVV